MVGNRRDAVIQWANVGRNAAAVLGCSPESVGSESLPLEGKGRKGVYGKKGALCDVYMKCDTLVWGGIAGSDGVLEQDITSEMALQMNRKRDSYRK